MEVQAFGGVGITHGLGYRVCGLGFTEALNLQPRPSCLSVKRLCAPKALNPGVSLVQVGFRRGSRD